MPNSNAIAEKTTWDELIECAKTAIASRDNDEWNEEGENDPWFSGQCKMNVMIVKLVGLTSEPYREPFEEYLKGLRRAYGRLNRLATENAIHAKLNRFVGQLEVLAEIAARLAHRTLPRETVKYVVNNPEASRFLAIVKEHRSISLAALGAELRGATEFDGGYYDALSDKLTLMELVRRDHFGKGARFSATSFGNAVLEQIEKEKSTVMDPAKK